MSCRCEVSRPHPSPLKSNCLRCGRKARPKPEPDPIVHHCARCRTDLHPGAPCGLLYWMDGRDGARMMERFCPDCLEVVYEGAVSYKTPAEVEEAHRGAP